MLRLLRAANDELRLSLRNLARQPSYALFVIFTLALGIGASTAVFSVMDALMLRPLPFMDPDRVLHVERVLPSGTILPDWLPASDARRVTESGPLATAAFSFNFAPVRTDGIPETIRGLAVSPNLFSTLGISPAQGRGLTAEDGRPGAPRVAVLAHQYFQEIGGAAGVIGSTIRIDNQLVTVVGVLPRNVRYPYPGAADVYVPLAADNTVMGTAVDRLNILMRLPAGGTVEQLTQQLAAHKVQLDEAAPSRHGWQIRTVPISSWRGNSEMRRAVWMLAGAVAVMLLIAAVNSTSLMLARATRRTRDFAVRRALGASRRRLIGQSLIESLLLGLAGGVLALLLAEWGVAAIRTLMPRELVFALPFEIEIQRRALVFAFLLSALTGIAFGILPALRAARTRITQAGLSARDFGAQRAVRLRGVLVVAQIALAITLLAGAGLFMRSLSVLLNVDNGYRANGLIVMGVHMPERWFADNAERMAFLRRLQTRVAAIGGVERATIAEGIPPGTGFMFDVKLEAEGKATVPGSQPLLLPRASVEPEFFEVLGTRLLDGRTFTSSDAPSANLVVIDEPLARFLWPRERAVGKRFRTDPEEDWLTVVGVVADVRLMGPDDRRGAMDMFFVLPRDSADSYMSIAVRANAPAAIVTPAIREAFQSLAPTLPLHRLRSVDDAILETVQLPRFLLALMLFLAATAMTLACVGLYGMLSFSIAQRSHELAVRLAIGADGTGLMKMMLRYGLRLAVAGSVIGALAAAGLSRFVTKLLFGISPVDPLTFAAVIALMITVAAFAAVVPSRRVLRIAPVSLLKTDN